MISPLINKKIGDKNSISNQLRCKRAYVSRETSLCKLYLHYISINIFPLKKELFCNINLTPIRVTRGGLGLLRLINLEMFCGVGVE